MADEDELAETYRLQVESAIAQEAQRRVSEKHNPEEIERLRNLSILTLTRSNHPDLIPALMSRLGPVRAALDGHGGSVIISSFTEEILNSGSQALSLVISLDGACISCGAAPGTLKGIQDDLLMDEEVISVQFDSSMLEWFDEIQREFILKYGEVSFVEV
ncbi:MAG: NifU family protein [Candidatus Thalassarchaeaceae archaeon]|nr:NifU family protein [Candidatus Thalassarchaeaceae archaeon]DAC33191.1 MAG TPA: NifU family protein [Candidatus Poseidoniales archaeon]HIH80679.1 NifU family protein [Candidatus Thalassarchaeaceae archaeon]|tara:strand:+ start:4068 stop:4547 length:480 start_codon:yes stop_codon:yes gene_type:complete